MPLRRRLWFLEGAALPWTKRSTGFSSTWVYRLPCCSSRTRFARVSRAWPGSASGNFRPSPRGKRNRCRRHRYRPDCIVLLRLGNFRVSYSTPNLRNLCPACGMGWPRLGGLARWPSRWRARRPGRQGENDRKVVVFYLQNPGIESATGPLARIGGTNWGISV